MKMILYRKIYKYIRHTEKEIPQEFRFKEFHIIKRDINLLR